ncbi:PQQ-binding-like beta-propeller repeat protein [Glycomyces buryatensis]|uniref:PQQ-like beta-propeller repeat protein n=1 Tax=Glycomyces buryatensis TaxID=2570927 RepID=A0A4S8QFL8_9ACTN|nr:PQQ-binding-like beta-propeller repeat protein [Glycomyces buryatensis]THV43423.1 PQQ-like beta-propeller repeat protein [Glycomyces buryatensis]
MSHSASTPGRHRTDARPSDPAASVGRPLARVFLRTAGLTALVAWAALLVWASFGTAASTGSSGVYMIIGTVASVALVAIVIATAASHPGLHTIVVALVAALFAAAAGWAVYSAMPEAGPDEFITHRAGVAALAYGFGVVGGGLLALSEFVVEGYAGGRRGAPKRMSRKISVLAAAIVLLAAAALAPAMQRWAELANQDVRVGDATAAGGWETTVDSLTELAGVERFVETPYGLLRVDHPTNPMPQAVTLVDPATGEAVWYHRRWNWRSSQSPTLSQSETLVGLSGPRADNPDDYQTRVLRTQTGEEVATADFNGSPGLLLALSDDRLLYAGERGEAFTAYDFEGEQLWQAFMPDGCEGTAAQITGDRLLMLADCVPAPDRPVARDYILAFDLNDGESVWTQEIDWRAQVAPGSFLVTEKAVIIDSRIEQRVTDGPFSARRFDHKLLAYDIADGEELWHNKGEQFGSTNSSACGGTLYLSQPTPESTAAGAASDRSTAKVASSSRTVQLVECYTAKHREGSWLGVMAYDLDTGERQYRKSVRLGFTPLDPEVARGWATVLPDNRALLAVDLSLDQTAPKCRLFEITKGDAEEIEFESESMPENWCQEAQLTTVASGAAISFVKSDGTRGIALVP